MNLSAGASISPETSCVLYSTRRCWRSKASLRLNRQRRAPPRRQPAALPAHRRVHFEWSAHTDRIAIDARCAFRRMIWLEAKPFTWTVDPDKIIAAVKRGHQALDSIH